MPLLDAGNGYLIGRNVVIALRGTKLCDQRTVVDLAIFCAFLLHGCRKSTRSRWESYDCCRRRNRSRFLPPSDMRVVCTSTVAIWPSAVCRKSWDYGDGLANLREVVGCSQISVSGGHRDLCASAGRAQRRFKAYSRHLDNVDRQSSSSIWGTSRRV